MVQRTFPCVFLSRTYSSYAICTKKKKEYRRNSQILSLERPTFASSNYPTNVRSKKRKKKNHPSRFPTPRKIATRNLNERIVPRYACCREFFPLSSLLFPLASLCTCARTLHALENAQQHRETKDVALSNTVIPYYAVHGVHLSTHHPSYSSIHPTRALTLFP